MITFPDYLKKYSSINSKFIDDFFGLHDYKIIFNEIYIDFSLVVKWLKTRKDSLKATLVNTYIENVDYNIQKGKSTGGRPAEIITISYECFRRLCMLSKTAKAEEVRTYFIDIEKHINKYKDHIIDALDKKVGILNNNMKPIVNIKSGVLYVLKTDLDIDGVYKIGRTKKFKERLNTHNSSHVNNVKVVFVFETDNINGVERCINAVLKDYQYKKRKEFYEIDLDIIKELLENCDKMILKAKNVANAKMKGNYVAYISKN